MEQISTAQISQALSQVIDPELGINVVDLGLIYEINVDDGEVNIVMTMTTVGCPATNYLRDAVQTAAAAVPGVKWAEVTVVWQPQWNPAMLSMAGKQYFGWEPEPDQTKEA